jgi:hypothetical protein
LLLDSTQRLWFRGTLALAVLAVALRIFLGWDVPGGLTGGTAAGLWYGVLGALLMILAGLLSAHRRLSAVRSLPLRRWIGSRQTWMRIHLWLGTLSVVFILCHSGWHLGGPLEIALWIVLAVTILSGFVGLAVQNILPTLITARISAEAPYEQIPHLCDAMRRTADEAVEQALLHSPGEPSTRKELQALYDRVRPFLLPHFDRSSPLADPVRAASLFGAVRSLPGMDAHAGLLSRLQGMCDERRQLGEQARLHLWLHLWLLAHIPITVALLVLGVAHAVTAVYW